MNRYLAVALFAAVLIGCADDKTKVAFAQPVQGDPIGGEEYDESYDDEREATLVAENEGPSAAAPCDVSFTKHLMPKLSTSCASSACHGDTAEPFVDDAAPQITYEGLRDFGFDDETWTDPHPTDSKLDDPSLKAAVDGWRKCGAPFE